MNPQLPQIQHSRLTRPVATSAKRAARVVRWALWRAMHPEERSAFLPASRPPALKRFFVDTVDGWRLQVRTSPACPGSIGDPVLVVSSGFVGSDVFRIGDYNWVSALNAAGFDVYMLHHRASTDAERMPSATPVNADLVIERDIPAVLEAICSRTGAQRVFLMGHGVGAVLAMAAAAAVPDLLMGTIALNPTWSVNPRGRLAWLGRVLPQNLTVPGADLGKLGLPVADRLVGGLLATNKCKQRELLAYAVNDARAAWLQQLHRWSVAGEPVASAQDLAFVDRLPLARCGLLLMHQGSTEEQVAANKHSLVRWGSSDRTMVSASNGGFFDLAVAPEDFVAPALNWLLRRRKGCWPSWSDAQILP